MSWPCQTCTFINTLSDATRCSICASFRDAASAAAAAEASEIRQLQQLLARAAPRQPAQRFDSDDEFDNESVRSDASGDSMSSMGGWLCSHCTTANRARSSGSTCKGCGADKASSDALAASMLSAPSRGAAHSSGKKAAADEPAAKRSRASQSPSARATRKDAAAAAAAAVEAEEEEEEPSTPPSKPSKRARSKTRSSRGASAAIPFVSPPAMSGLSLAAAAAAAFGTPASYAPSFFSSAAGSSSAAAVASPAKASAPPLTQEDSRAELSDAAATAYAQRMHPAQLVHKKAARQQATITADAQCVAGVLKQLFDELGYNPSASAGATAAPPSALSACASCFTAFDADCEVFTVETCGHREFCRDCFAQVVGIKVSEETVTPWLCCPSSGCRHPLSVRDLTSVCSTAQLAHLCCAYMRKRLVRSDAWVGCKTPKCLGGFVIELPANKKPPKPKECVCAICDKKQTVERGKDGELDAGFQEMIAAGTLRPCPKCKHLTLKEHGVCNVLQCVKCAVWWNWRTRETGKDSYTLKQKARMSGSLWEAGELEYQRRLEHSNPEEFRKLLERNGQKYDPNYIRGQG